MDVIYEWIPQWNKMKVLLKKKQIAVSQSKYQ